MAFRGRGRGRGWFGRGGAGFGFAKQEPFIPFPDIELPNVKDVKQEKALVVWGLKLQNYWKASPYYLEETESKKSQDTDIERFSDRAKRKAKLRRGALDQFLLYTSDNFPQELIPGLKKQQQEQPNQKKVRWDPESDMQTLDFFEKLEQKLKGQEEKGVKEKEGEDEDEVEDDGLEETDEEFSDDGDYNQNIDFDDDEDDFNMEADDDDEPTY